MDTDAAAGPDRRNRILDAAERVFALEGYHGTTLREIARAADVKLSLIGYHFESKLVLYAAIFQRRQHVNDERLRRLEAIENLDAPDAVEQIVSAFMDPVVELKEDGAWYRRLVLREAADPSRYERGVMGALFDPMARKFIEAIKCALPGKPPGFYEWSYLFAVGAFTQSAFDDRIASLGGEPGAPEKNDFLRSFIAAAWRYG